MNTHFRFSASSHALCSPTLTVILAGLLFLSGCAPMQGNRSAQRLGPNGQAQRTDIYYAGYSKKYLPLRENLAAGKVEDVQTLLDQEETKVMEKAKTEAEMANELRLVGLMERASLSLQTGKPEKAIKYCRLSQELIEGYASESYTKEGLSAVGGMLAGALGAGECGRYVAPGYEKVLLLDIASMAYLLEGDERAFNVARLAIQWQDEEKDRFDKELAKITEEETKTGGNSGSQQGNQNRTQDALQKELAKYDDIALTVPNAFVNPFGDYVTGMVNEFKSIEKKSLLSNAHIAYKQALELNPKSKVIQQAVADTEKKKPADRLIHIIALDGFVPEKKVLSMPIDQHIDIEFPSYNPIPSKVATIKVTNEKGKVLATLAPIANVEALALRHQKDCLPGMFAMVFATIVRDAGMVALGDAVMPGLGGIFKEATDKSMEPDTTSWMTLPSRILAARIYSGKGVNKLVIRSYDASGKQLAEKKISLSEGNNHFILARSIDQTMYAYPSKKIWSGNSSI